jgi:hypothetical protein
MRSVLLLKCAFFNSSSAIVEVGEMSWNRIARFKNVKNYLNTNIYSYLETSGGQSSNIYLNAAHIFNTSVN